MPAKFLTDFWCSQLTKHVFAGLIGLVALSLPRAAIAEPYWRFEATQADNQTSINEDGSLKLRRIFARRVSGNQDRFNLVWAVIPADLYRVWVRVVNIDGILPALSQCQGDLAMTGGFSQGRRSKGWVVSDRNVISEFANDFDGGGAFVISNNVPQIIRKADISKQTDIDQAVQSTPILIFDGKYDGASEREDDASWNRLAIGVTTEGNIIIALVYGPKATLGDFGRLLIDLSQVKNAPSIRAAIGLDSRITGTIKLHRSGQHFGAERREFVPNILCFERKVTQ